MAEILETQGANAEHPSNPEGGEQPVATLDDFVTPAATPEPEANPTSTEEDDVPDKYKGKTAADLVQMHQEAERLLGRQSGEVGELRKVIDQFIQAPAQPQAQAPEEEVDFFDDPQAAVAKTIESHPAIQGARAATVEMQRSAAIASLQAKHPDLPDVLGDPAFKSWVDESPTRQRLYAEADKSFNADSADELVSTWKERKQLAASTMQVEETARKQEVQKASTGVTQGSGETSQKVYRRSDIIKLMKTDPQRYQQMQPEIMKAYAEKRVR